MCAKTPFTPPHSLRLFLCCIVLTSLLAPTINALPPAIDIALHAQSNFNEHGWVAGSEVTTMGMKAALDSHPEVNKVGIFSPFNYGDLDVYDVVITEGYTGTLPRFIHAVRSANPDVVILHYLLDLYPHADTIIDLDVDAYLTNSKVLEERVQSHGFRSFWLPLAVDTNAFQKEMNGGSGNGNKYSDIDLVYVGQYSPSKTHLKGLLVEASEFANERGLNFTIYGHGWGRFREAFEGTEVLDNWRGVLPFNDLSDVYSSAKLVLGTTEEAQEELGMINNRVFEALACSRRILLPVGRGEMTRGLKAVLGEDLERVGVYVTDTNEGSVRGRLEELWEGREKVENEVGRREVEESHSWDGRMGRVLEWVRSWDENLVTRPNRPKVVLFRGETVGEGGKFHEAMQKVHDEGFWDYLEVDGGELVGKGGNATFLKRVDVLLVEDEVGGKVETIMRDLRVKEVRRKGIIYAEGAGRDEEAENEYDIVGVRGGGEGGHRIWDTSNVTSENLKEGLISRASLLPPRRASISILNLTVEGSMVTAHAETRDFDCPEAGGWCVWLYLAGEDEYLSVSCVGDRNGGSKEVKVDEKGRKVEVISTYVAWDMEKQEKGEYELRISMHGGEIGEGGIVGGFKEGWVVGSLRFIWDGVREEGGDEL